ncbi:MAG: DUF1207 domain-containing protein [Ignavibacteria bacterium]|nr:DUF1207 domain-containing protein [Ignavibacteria bacterium]
MRKVLFIIFATVITITTVKAQETEWFPSDLLIHPFISNFLEPKMGVQFGVGHNNIRLDIGNSRDFIRYKTDTLTTISFGGDFFTYTKLRGEEDFHFPVEAVDYLFGVNAGYVKKCADYTYGMRFRFSHISAHFSDGHYDKIAGAWLDNRLPQVYSREFLEFMPFYEKSSFRAYGGFTWIYHVVPSDVKKWMVHGGAEYSMPDAICAKVSPFVSFDLRTVAIDAVTLNNTVSAGIKIGSYNGSGVRIHFTHFKGKNIHGEYYNLDEEYSAIGVNIDL